VIYMGMGGLDAIADGLLAALPAATPRRGRAGRERRLRAPPGDDARRARRRRCGRQRIASPAIVVVGDVLRGAQAWRERLGAAAGSQLSARA
jgi:siroheme synthase